jgi:hypothetical protein
MGASGGRIWRKFNNTRRYELLEQAGQKSRDLAIDDGDESCLEYLKDPRGMRLGEFVGHLKLRPTRNHVGDIVDCPQFLFELRRDDVDESISPYAVLANRRRQYLPMNT